MIRRPLPALLALAVAMPLGAEEPTGVVIDPPAAVETVAPPAEAPVGLEPVAASKAFPAPPRREVEGTKLLFLRLTLRIKQIEQDLLSASPEGLMEHMVVAVDLLEQLHNRPLDDDEVARAQRAEEYLQQLTERYVELHRKGATAAK